MPKTTTILFALVTLTFAAVSSAQSQRVVGGGCPRRTPPRVSGPLKVNTHIQLDDPGCFTAQNGFAILFFGAVLPPSQWVPIRLSSSAAGPATCHVAILPAVPIDVTTMRLPVRFGIPNNPALRGAKFGMQSFCRECGFAGCYQLLTQALEITIG